MTEQTAEKKTRRIPVMPILKLNADGTDGVLAGSTCNNCGVTHLGAPAVCLKCMSTDLKRVELGKSGVLHSYTVIYAPPAGWQGPVPYTLGSGGLTEGPEILAEMIDCPREALKVGLKLRLVVVVGGKNKDGDEIMVYKWKPAGK